MALTFAGYDPQRQELRVRFDGGEIYAYSGVSEDVAEGFRWAEAVGVSTGTFFQRYVKRQPARRIA